MEIPIVRIGSVERPNVADDAPRPTEDASTVIPASIDIQSAGEPLEGGLPPISNGVHDGYSSTLPALRI